MWALRTRLVVFCSWRRKTTKLEVQRNKEVPGSATLEKRREGLRNKNIYPGVHSYIN